MKTLGKIVIGLLLVCGIAGGVAYGVVKALPNSATKSIGGNVSVPAQDLIGSTSGTSTTLIALGASGTLGTTQTISSSAWVGEETSNLALNFKFTTVSTTAPTTWRVQKSNDDACNTTNDLNAATNTVRSDIRWFDVPPTSASGGTVTIGAGTTTYSYIPGANQSISQQFTDWNARCVKLIVTSASTSVYTQLKTTKIAN